METLIETAIRYSRLGLSIVAVDSGKAPIWKYKRFMVNPPTQAELRAMFAHERTTGMAIVCGKISGGLEGIDIDVKYDLTGILYPSYLEKLRRLDAPLVEKLVVNATRNGGGHLIYRCPTVEGNCIMARRPTTEAEKNGNPKDRVRVLIETRGEGGLLVAPPSPGYQFVHNDFSKIPIISTMQRELLFSVGRSLNLYQETINRKPYPQKVFSGNVSESPFADFDVRGDIIGLLERHGWTQAGDAPGKVRFKRPGDTSQASSGDYNYELGMFSTFSTSTDFEPNRGYRPYAVFAILECGGDFKRAARNLLDMGFGIRRYNNLNAAANNTRSRQQSSNFKFKL